MFVLGYVIGYLVATQYDEKDKNLALLELEKHLNSYNKLSEDNLRAKYNEALEELVKKDIKGFVVLP